VAFDSSSYKLILLSSFRSTWHSTPTHTNQPLNFDNLVDHQLRSSISPTNQQHSTTTTMDCFQDFCLACDKQCEGSYCSQSCRLADLEKAPHSGCSSPLTPSSEHSWESTQPGYVLTPAYNFTTERDEKRLSTSSASSLSPSSSRTSLSSASSSSPSGTGLSKQAHAALQDYFSSFDQTRAAKRRSSLR
jgi:hypothetical protein